MAVSVGGEHDAAVASAAADANLTLDGDAQGTGRIRAALEAHTWSGLVMKDGTTSSRGWGGDVDTRGYADEASGDDGESDSGSAGEAAVRSTVPSKGRGSANGKIDSGDTADAGTAASRMGHGLLFEDDGDGGSSSDIGEEGGDGMDELELMMAEIARARGAGAGASDEARRTMAAAAATRMMSMFLDDGGSDDDEGDHEPLPGSAPAVRE